MTKLSTIKDLVNGDSINRYDLKYEAIKWIKEIKEEGETREFNDEHPWYDYECSDINGFIKEFFNLSEEDLK